MFPNERTTSLPQKRRPSRDLQYVFTFCLSNEVVQPCLRRGTEYLPPVSSILDNFKSTQLPLRKQRKLTTTSPRRIHIANQQPQASTSTTPSGMQSSLHSIEARPDSYSPPQDPLQISPTIVETAPTRGEPWETHAELFRAEDGSAKWKCNWPETNDGVTAPCGYQSKKQLVKRHIETTHLKLR